MPALKDGDSVFCQSKGQACLLTIIKDSGSLNSGLPLVTQPTLHPAGNKAQEASTEMLILWLLLLPCVITCPLSLSRESCIFY